MVHTGLTAGPNCLLVPQAPSAWPAHQDHRSSWSHRGCVQEEVTCLPPCFVSIKMSQFKKNMAACCLLPYLDWFKATE